MNSLVMLGSWSGFFIGLLIALFILICLLLIGVILLQKGRGGGLSSAFGGAGGASPFGAKTGDVFTWITVVLAGLFLLLAVGMNLLYVPSTYKTEGAQPSAESGAPAPLTPGDEQPGTGELPTPPPPPTGSGGGPTMTPPSGESPAPPPAGGGDANP